MEMTGGACSLHTTFSQINLPLIQKAPTHHHRTPQERVGCWPRMPWLVSHESILLKRLCKSPSKQWLHERIPYQTRVGKARSGHLKYTTCDWCHSFTFIPILLVLQEQVGPSAGDSSLAKALGTLDLQTLPTPGGRSSPIRAASHSPASVDTCLILAVRPFHTNNRCLTQQTEDPEGTLQSIKHRSARLSWYLLTGMAMHDTRETHVEVIVWPEGFNMI